MKNKLLLIPAVAIGLLVASRPVLGHHGAQMFDPEHITTVKGTVIELQFVNPHIHLLFDAKDDRGNVEKWNAEGGSPNMMARNGWNRISLKPGDQITVSGRAAKDGSKTMRLEKVVLADGKELIPWNN